MDMSVSRNNHRHFGMKKNDDNSNKQFIVKNIINKARMETMEATYFN